MTRRTLLHVGALVLLCLAASFVGPDTHGLTNWQESQRLVVAREMQDRGAWLVPTFRGQAYLAKPPMIYWAQIALAEARGSRVDLLDLRLVVALAGLVGVVLTYAVARRMLDAGGAFIASACLATGLLYVRSTRVGELDILLAPLTVAGVWGVLLAWRRVEEPLGRRAGPIVLATAATAAAGLTKGPPAVALIGLATYGGMALHAALESPIPARARRAAMVAGSVAAVATIAFAASRGVSLSDAPGVALLAALAAASVALVALLARPVPLRTLWRVLSRTHPVLVLGGGFAAYFAWWFLASRHVDPAVVEAIAREQVDNDLQLLVPAAPIRNLEALAFGCGLGSMGLFLAPLRRARSLAPRDACLVVAWVGLGLALLSLAGKGVPRYLTPLWPGVAVVGGAALARLAAGPWRRVLVAAIVVLAVAQGAWFGYGRERVWGARSPRALVLELRALGVDPARLAAYEFYTPALDFYAQSPVMPVRTAAVTGGIPPWSLAELRAHAARAPITVLLRAPGADPDSAPAARALVEAGLALEFLPTRARFVIDNGRAEVRAARATASTP